jgi:hemoglobin
MARTIFERNGGFGSVGRIVLDFYDRVLDDDVLGPYFEDVDMRRLIDHQTKFMATVMGGPASYSDETLQQVHAHLGIDHEAFGQMLVVLRATLSDHGFSSADVDAVARAMQAREGVIVAQRARG